MSYGLDTLLDTRRKDNYDEPLKEVRENISEKIAEPDERIKKVKRTKAAKSDLVQIRDFPKSLLNMAKTHFPDATAKNAVAAYMYAYRDPNFDSDYADVPKEVIEMAKKIDTNKRYSHINKDLRSVTDEIRGINERLEANEIAMAYLILDRLGFRNDNPGKIRDIDFDNAEIGIVSDMLNEQARDNIQESKIRERTSFNNSNFWRKR